VLTVTGPRSLSSLGVILCTLVAGSLLVLSRCFICGAENCSADEQQCIVGGPCSLIIHQMSL